VGIEFTPIFFMILVGISVAVGMLSMSYLLSPGRTKTPGNRVKQMPYESGMDPIGDARQRFDVRYYLVAIEFLIFDVELLLLYPWAVAQWHRDEVSSALDATIGVPVELRTMAFLGALAFIGILLAGFAYTWRKGVYEWR
jgi:NADH-quinone oxidoreductase subunit A